MNFSKRLVQLRKERNLTQRQIFESVGISEIGYKRYEYGAREPAHQNLIAIADYFDVSIDYLVGRTDNPNSHKN